MMKTVHKTILIALFLATALLYFYHMSDVPFHPDEATIIYTSQDVETLFKDPLALAWEPGRSLTRLDKYRLLDEPLTRLIFGILFKIAQLPVSELNADWDWSRTWMENLDANAMPAPEFLQLARLAMTVLTVLGIGFITWTVVRIGGEYAGILVLVLLAVNGILLLHGRRAMREGTMIFGIGLAIWALTFAGKKPWAAGIIAAVAVCARYLVAPAALVLLLAAIWTPAKNKSFRDLVAASGQFGVSFIAVFLLLQPVLWKHPISGAKQILETRVQFTGRAVSTSGVLAPEILLEQPAQKTVQLISQTYFAEPAYADVGNYVAAQSDAVRKYSDLPATRLWRGMVAGAASFILIFSGCVLACYSAFRLRRGSRMFVSLVGIWIVLQAVFIYSSLQFNFQRYYLPLLVLTATLASLAFAKKPDNPHAIATSTASD